MSLHTDKKDKTKVKGTPKETQDKVCHGDITDFYSDNDIDPREFAKSEALRLLKEDFYSTPDIDKYDWLDKAESMKDSVQRKANKIKYEGTKVKAFFGHKKSRQIVQGNREKDAIRRGLATFVKPVAESHGVPGEAVDMVSKHAVGPAHSAVKSAGKKVAKYTRENF